MLQQLSFEFSFSSFAAWTSWQCPERPPGAITQQASPSSPVPVGLMGQVPNKDDNLG